MKILKTFEQLKGFYIGQSRFIIVTEDESKVFFRYPGSGEVLMDSKILDEKFHKPINSYGDTFLYETKDDAQRRIDSLNSLYYFYFLNYDLAKKYFESDNRSLRRLIEKFSETIKTETPEDKIKFKIIEYNIGAQKMDNDSIYF